MHKFYFLRKRDYIISEVNDFNKVPIQRIFICKNGIIVILKNLEMYQFE